MQTKRRDNLKTSGAYQETFFILVLNEIMLVQTQCEYVCLFRRAILSLLMANGKPLNNVHIFYTGGTPRDAMRSKSKNDANLQ